MKKFPQQLIPLIIMFLFLIAALITARHYLVPESFGRYGHYRADAVDEEAAREISYAGYEACVDCHDDIYEAKQQSNHSTVSCEVCHGPAQAHVDDPDEFLPEILRGRGNCARCHGFDLSRPSGFPQIVLNLHNPGRACMACHNPHEPVLPHAPDECSACHRKVVNQKSVSHHATLPCIQCHEVPDEHSSNPNYVRAEKPSSRSTCGECHARGASSAREIPRVDIDTHGERYLCWDCHYPHSPEAH